MTAKQDRSSKVKVSKASKEGKKGGKSKAFAAFSQLLFEWAPPEDLAAYDAAALESSAFMAMPRSKPTARARASSILTTVSHAMASPIAGR